MWIKKIEINEKPESLWIIFSVSEKICLTEQDFANIIDMLFISQYYAYLIDKEVLVYENDISAEKEISRKSSWFSSENADKERP